MNNIEDDLMRALRRQDPPPDFVGKIMGRVASGEGLESESYTGSNKVVAFRPKPRVMVWLATAAAAACLVGLFVTRSYISEHGKLPGSDSASVSAGKAQADATPPSLATGAAPARDDKQDAGSAEPKQVVDSKKPHGRTRSYSRGAGGHPSEEARRVEEQLKLALAITSAKLGYAQRSIREADGTSGPDRDVNR